MNMNITERDLKRSRIYKLEHELRLAKLEVQRAQNELHLDSSTVMTIEELITLLPEFEKAAIAYMQAIKRYKELLEQRKKIDGAA